MLNKCEKIKIGETFGYLTTVSLAFTKNNIWYITCKCVCGNEKNILARNLIRYNTKSCGCKKNDLIRLHDDINGKRKKVKIGDIFGYWLVISNPIYKFIGRMVKYKTQCAICRCICGFEKELVVGRLKNGKSKSCGCKKSELLSKYNKHGDYKTKLYKSWTGMKSRCCNLNGVRSNSYVKKGITVCDEWKNNYLEFKKWSLSHGFKDGLSLDRIDVNGNYCPENCEWVTREENSRRQTGNRDKKIKELELRVKELEGELKAYKNNETNKMYNNSLDGVMCRPS